MQSKKSNQEENNESNVQQGKKYNQKEIMKVTQRKKYNQ